MGAGIEVFRSLAKHPRAYSFAWLASRWLAEMAKVPTKAEMRAAGLCDCGRCRAAFLRSR